MFHGTTILCVRRPHEVVLVGDGQVTLDKTIMKGSARKVRRLAEGSVLAGFAGSTSDAFIAATFVGFPPAAKLAFVVLGPMMDFKLLFMYGLVFRRRLTITLAAGLMVVIGSICVLLRSLIL